MLLISIQKTVHWESSPKTKLYHSEKIPDLGCFPRIVQKILAMNILWMFYSSKMIFVELWGSKLLSYFLIGVVKKQVKSFLMSFKTLMLSSHYTSLFNVTNKNNQPFYTAGSTLKCLNVQLWAPDYTQIKLSHLHYVLKTNMPNTVTKITQTVQKAE